MHCAGKGAELRDHAEFREEGPQHCCLGCCTGCYQGALGPGAHSISPTPSIFEVDQF